MPNMNRRFTAGLTALLMAVSAAAAATKEEEVARYVNDLKSKDAAVRKTAAEQIGKIALVKASAAKPALHPLIDALKDSSSSVREAAALAVGRLDEPAEAVSALTKVLKDEKDLGVRVAAARGLGQMGPEAKDALPTLRDVWTAARDAGRSQQRLVQATRDAMEAIRGGRKKN
jgi:HEAT repeat protein